MTRALGNARVDLLVLHGPLEESLARLARQQAIVIARHLVAANWAQFLDNHVFSVGKVGWPRYATRDNSNLANSRMTHITTATSNVNNIISRIPRWRRIVVVALLTLRRVALITSRQLSRIAGSLDWRRIVVVVAAAAAIPRRRTIATCGREQTRVDLLVAARRVVALEEALAILASQQPVLIAAHLVAAHWTALLQHGRAVEEHLETALAEVRLTIVLLLLLLRHLLLLRLLLLQLLLLLGLLLLLLGMGMAHGRWTLRAIRVWRGAVLLAAVCLLGARWAALRRQLKRRHVERYQARVVVLLHIQ